jgi:type I restriction enzyme M protein
MLDNGTKKRIDSARDILVGKVPDPKSQVEQITIALIYKFMDDMDSQTEELGGKATFFTGEFKQYAWSRLLDHRLSGYERLLLYAEGIEKMNINENIPQLFRDTFKGAFLPYRDPETLNLFLKEINGFDDARLDTLFLAICIFHVPSFEDANVECVYLGIRVRIKSLQY